MRSEDGRVEEVGDQVMEVIERLAEALVGFSNQLVEIRREVYFYCYIFVSLSGVKILNIVLYMLRHGVYACVRRWAICVPPRGV